MCCFLSVLFLVFFVFYLVSPFSFQPFLMSNSALNERSMSNPLCDFRLGTVVTSDYETPVTAAGESEDWVAAARIRLLLRWLRAFALDEMASVARLFPAVPSFQTVVLAFDAYLSGGGATLTTAGGTMSYTATQWTEPDHQVLGAAAHDPAFQALWEAYTLLVALYTWRSRLADELGQLVIHGDAQGVLQAVIVKKARSPMINLVVVEMKLALVRSMHSVAAAHFW